MKGNRIAFTLIFCCLIVGNSWAQVSTSKLSINGEDLSWQQVADILQEQISGKLYYNTADFDSLRFNINQSNSSLRSILNELFENTALRYTIYQDNSVFITKGQAISIGLPVGFFSPESDLEQVTEEAPPVFMIDEAAAENERNLESKLITIGQSNGRGDDWRS